MVSEARYNTSQWVRFQEQYKLPKRYRDLDRKTERPLDVPVTAHAQNSQRLHIVVEQAKPDGDSDEAI